MADVSNIALTDATCRECGCSGNIRLVACRGLDVRVYCNRYNCQHSARVFLDGSSELWDIWLSWRPDIRDLDAKQIERQYAGRLGFSTRMERGIYPHEMNYGDALKMGFAMMAEGRGKIGEY